MWSRGAEPDNPRAIEPARELLQDLERLGRAPIGGPKLIAGHFCGGAQAVGWSGWEQFARGMGPWEFSMREVEEIHRRTGKWVGMLECWICPGEPYDGWVRPDGETFRVEDHGMVFDDRKHLIASYIDWHRRGGICHVSASPWAPLDSRYGFRSCREDPGYSREDVKLERILTPGTEEHRRWRFQLDRMAVFFEALEVEGIPVIFRPFTEQEGTSKDGWWYSRGVIGAEGHIRLWRDCWRYLTETKGLDNILWEFQGIAGPTDDYYPGDGFVDLFATRSCYGEGKAITPIQGRPSGIGEVGRKADYDAFLRASLDRQPDLCYFLTWGGGPGPLELERPRPGGGRYPGYNESFTRVMKSDYVISLGDLRNRSHLPRSQTQSAHYTTNSGSLGRH